MTTDPCAAVDRELNLVKDNFERHKWNAEDIALTAREQLIAIKEKLEKRNN